MLRPFFATITLLCSLTLLASELSLFEEYERNDAKDFQEKIKKENAGLLEADVKQAKDRIKKLQAEKNLVAQTKEFERIASANSDNFQVWTDFALHLIERYKTNEDDYDIKSKIKKVSVILYKLAKTDKEKLLSLAFSAAIKSYEGDEQHAKLLKYVLNNTLLLDVKKEYSFVASLLDFKYVDYKVETNASPAKIAFNFNHPLQKIDNLKDYFEISPAIDGKFSQSESSIYIHGAQFGTVYNITIKPGIKNILGDSIKEPKTLGVKIADQQSRLGFQHSSYVLQKKAELLLPLTSLNVDTVTLKIYRMNDRNLDQQTTKRILHDGYFYGTHNLENTEGEAIYTGELKIENKKNALVTTNIPLNKLIESAKPGVYIAHVETKSSLYAFEQATQAFVITDLGASVFSSNDGLFADIRSLSTAKVIEGSKVELIALNKEILASATTDTNGKVYFTKESLRGKGGNRPGFLYVYGKNGDFLYINLRTPAFDLSDRGVEGRNNNGAFDAYMYTDRGVFRPGEKITFHTLFRNSKGTAEPNIPLTFKILRPDGIVVKEIKEKGNDVGFYDVDYQLQETSTTGIWSVQTFLDPTEKPLYEHKFSVEDFVPARILVKLNASETFITKSKDATVNIKASYLFGTPAGDLTTEGIVLFEKHPNPFPSFKGYVFGNVDETSTVEREALSIKALDEKGQGTVTVNAAKAPDATSPLRARVRMSVFDRGGKPQLGTVNLLTYTKPFYIGLKTIQDRVDGKEESAEVNVLAVDLDQKQIDVKDLQWKCFFEAVSYTWYQKDGVWKYMPLKDEQLLQEGMLSLQAEKATLISVPTKQWGNYIVEVTDPKTGVQSRFRLTKGWSKSDNQDIPDQLKIRTDKKEYRSGEEVTLHIDSPFNGEALITFGGNTILSHSAVTLQQGDNVLKLPIREHYAPGTYIMVSAFRPLDKSEKPEDKLLPQRAMGVTWIGVDRENHTLKVVLDHVNEMKPNTALKCNLHVTDAAQKSVAGPVYITASCVDEGILMLTDFSNPNPSAFFLGQKVLGLDIRDIYSRLIQAVDGNLGALKVGGDEGALARNLAALSKRSFKIISLATKLTELKDGKGEVSFDIPDFNGALRLNVVALSKEATGAATSSLKVKDDLVVEGILPRFLAPLDKSTMTLSLHNMAKEKAEYVVKIEHEGPISLPLQLKSIEIDSEKEELLQIPLEAKKEGDAKITVTVEGPKEFKQTYVYELSVRAGQGLSTVSKMMVLDGKKTYTLLAKDSPNFDKESMTIEASYSATLPWKTENYVKALSVYPYACTEQLIGRGYASVFLIKRDKENEKKHSRDLDNVVAKVVERQQSDGSFSLWPGSTLSQRDKIWITAYALDLLLSAKEASITVPKFVLDNGFEFLNGVLRTTNDKTKTDIMNVSAYALYVLNKASMLEGGAVRYFYDNFYQHLKNPLSKAFVIACLMDFGEEKRLEEALKNADVLKKDKQSLPYYGNCRDSVAIVAVLRKASVRNPKVAEEVQKIIVPKIKFLAKSLSAGFLSTQEQAWLIQADLAHPESNQKINLLINGQKLEGEKGSLTYALPKDSTELNVENMGETPLFQTITYSGRKVDVKEESNQIKVVKKYFTIDGKTLEGDKVSQTQNVVVVIEGDVLDKKHHQLLVVDMIAAGVSIEPLTSLNWLENLTPLNYRAERDDKFVCAFDLKKENRHFKVAYLLRAITPGDYNNPGIMIEDMYLPEVFATTKVAKLVIEAVPKK